MGATALVILSTVPLSNCPRPSSRTPVILSNAKHPRAQRSESALGVARPGLANEFSRPIRLRFVARRGQAFARSGGKEHPIQQASR